MKKAEIEQAVKDAGWELDGGFEGHLVVGEDRHLSILVPRWAWETDEPAFELCDGEGEEDVTYWVREVPTPERAVELLEKHGGSPEEERGNPRRKNGGGEG